MGMKERMCLIRPGGVRWPGRGTTREGRELEPGDGAQSELAAAGRGSGREKRGQEWGESSSE